MNLLVLGATGNTGRQFVDLALNRGHKITAIVRSISRMDERDGLTAIQGNVLDSSVLHQAVRGVDAVISCLGIRKKDPADPWSQLLSPEDFTTRCTSIAVEAMKMHGIERLVVISSAGVGDSWETVDSEIRDVIKSSNIAKVFLDLNNMEQVLILSELDTLAIRPVALVIGDASEEAKIVDRFEKTSKIFTGDVAQWILDAVERPTPFVHRTEMIGLS
jgi:putative NADH-flavin reductase